VRRVLTLSLSLSWHLKGYNWIVTLETKPLFFISLHENATGLDKKMIRECRIASNAKSLGRL